MRIPGLWIHGITVFSARDGIYKDLITGQEMEAAGVNVPAYGFFWLKKIN